MPTVRPVPVLIALNLVTLGALVWSNVQSQAQNSAQDHVRARVIDLVNARGEVRAQLYVQDNGGGGIRMYNGKGEIRSKYGALDDGGAGILLMDESTNPTVQLKSTTSAPQLKLIGPAGERLISP